MVRYIFGEITDEVAESVITAANAGELDELWVCSNGGDLCAALAIYDVIVGKDIKVVGTGCVQSAGLIIFLGGSERLATRNTRFMSHDVSIALEEGSKLTESDVAELAALHENVRRLFIERCGLPEDAAESLVGQDNNFGIDEAISMGFVHREWKDDSTRFRQGSTGFRSVDGRKSKRS